MEGGGDCFALRACKAWGLVVGRARDVALFFVRSRGSVGEDGSWYTYARDRRVRESVNLILLMGKLLFGICLFGSWRFRSWRFGSWRFGFCVWKQLEKGLGNLYRLSTVRPRVPDSKPPTNRDWVDVRSLRWRKLYVGIGKKSEIEYGVRRQRGKVYSCFKK